MSSSSAVKEVRAGDYVLTLKACGQELVEWFIHRDKGGKRKLVFSGQAPNEAEALRRGRLQLSAVGLSADNWR
ncbi:MAG: hypothetical protein KM310_03375 [Clostridiales bacterium]|nr:hypothetical protein [Clostridiales bacterium]